MLGIGGITTENLTNLLGNSNYSFNTFAMSAIANSKNTQIQLGVCIYVVGQTRDVFPACSQAKIPQRRALLDLVLHNAPCLPPVLMFVEGLSLRRLAKQAEFFLLTCSW